MDTRSTVVKKLVMATVLKQYSELLPLSVFYMSLISVYAP